MDLQWKSEEGSFLNARKLLFYNAVFRSFFNPPGVISQRARAVSVQPLRSFCNAPWF